MVSLKTIVAAAVAVAPVAMAKPEQIRAVQDPIFHYYLQRYPSDPKIPVMGPEASSEYFDIAGTIRSANSSQFLSIAAGETTSYKTLTFTSTGAGATSAWALEGDTIITSQTSSWGRQLNFLACRLGAADSSYWQVYLQTGSQVPAGKTCSNYQSLHLPCLC